MEFEADPKLFRELNQPFDNIDALDAAVRAFREDLMELRKKHKLANVLLLLQSSALSADGEEGQYMSPMFFGDVMQQEGMAAYLYGRAARDRREIIGKYLSKE